MPSLDTWNIGITIGINLITGLSFVYGLISKKESLLKEEINKKLDSELYHRLEEMRKESERLKYEALENRVSLVESNIHRELSEIKDSLKSIQEHMLSCKVGVKNDR